MSKRSTTYLLAAVAGAALLAVASGVANASPAASGSAAAANKVVPIVMADPGCHWFVTAGKKTAKLTVTGKATFLNRDEAALIFKGAGFYRRVPVNKTISVTKPGTYKITMVGQYKHDNTLVLVVK